MRIPAILLALTVSAPAASAVPAPAPVAKVPAQVGSNCPRTTSHFAGKGSMYRGDRIAPKKLAELPPAIGYMAVLRTVDGCEVPMTIIEYRTGRRP